MLVVSAIPLKKDIWNGNTLYQILASFPDLPILKSTIHNILWGIIMPVDRKTSWTMDMSGADYLIGYLFLQ